MMQTITVDEGLKQTVALGVLRLSKITLPDDNGNALWQELSTLSTEMRNRYSGLTVGQVVRTNICGCLDSGYRISRVRIY